MGACAAPTPPRKRWQGPHPRGALPQLIRKRAAPPQHCQKGAALISANSAILQRSLIADAMALRAPRCRLCACGGSHRPHTPMEAWYASPQLFLKKGASQKRGQSVSDGVSRASFCVFAVKILAVLLQRLSGPSAYSGERLRSSIFLAPSCATDQDLAS